MYLRKATFVVEDDENSGGFAGEEVDDGLVVLELDGRPVNVLFGVLFLLQSENVLVEEKL